MQNQVKNHYCAGIQSIIELTLEMFMGLYKNHSELIANDQMDNAKFIRQLILITRCPAFFIGGLKFVGANSEFVQ